MNKVKAMAFLSECRGDHLPTGDGRTLDVQPRDRYWGRPVGFVIDVDGSLYVSDDSGGKIYRFFNAGSP